MDDKYLPLLSKQNCWWEGRIEDDVHLTAWRAQAPHWMPFNLKELPLEAFSLNIITGPRQAGKTTLIKFAVEKLLKDGVQPKSIFYLRCDEVSDASQLREIIEAFLAHGGSGEVFIFLDEITEVAGWEKTLKGFVDDGDFRKAVVTASGSNAFQLRRGSELFPGRRGSGRDILVLPLSFRQYLEVVDAERAALIPRLAELHPILIAEARKLLAQLPRLQKHLLDYFQCGGFPLAIPSHLKHGYVSEDAKEAYKSWVVGDILKNGKSDAIGREILKVILSKAPTPVSWEGIAQETSIKSPPTVASYVELLERLFVILPLYAINPDTGSREFAKNKKLHLTDPFLWNLCEEWCLQKIERKTDVLAEACLAYHIARHLTAKYRARRLSERVAYWRNGHEVDVVAQSKDGLAGFEMKWSDKKTAFPYKVGPVKNVTYISRSYFNERNPAVVPLAIFLAML
ncbi:ATPase [Candidatus Micrarchaeota archaeon CG_4_10_14_0_2_um_filter_49_7]|nr:MAG: hypothetical protein AUJ13_02865 [Candidatus Micrarchaeota archaeon CG1_02_49_24]PIZ97798.1 MAG: ATPase [Candidatus Micrarchaeota archaeon CG_4_10_14_0_2_um_filter_49_7]HII54006.1 ATP-binding protein [Candidatus Micrarchaeota archaeon]